MKREKVSENKKLMLEWSDKNTLDPTKVTCGSHKKALWKCLEKGHEWTAMVSSRASGNNCPHCSGRKVCKDNCLATTHPELAKEWSNKNNFSPKSITAGSNKKAIWKCLEKGHEWKVAIYHRTMSKSGCPHCSGRMPTKETRLATIYPDLVKEWSSRNIISPHDVTTGSNKKVWWVCLEKGHEWAMIVNHRTSRGHNCPYCSGRRVCKDNCLAMIYPDLAKEWSDKNNFSPEDVTPGSCRMVWWKCLKKGHEWLAQINSRSKGNGCSKCSKVVSKKSQLWLDETGVSVENREEFKILNNKRYIFDGFDEALNTVYEFYGDYWHGNLEKYNENDINTVCKKTYGELYKKTMQREKEIKKYGYKLITIWESDWDKLQV